MAPLSLVHSRTGGTVGIGDPVETQGDLEPLGTSQHHEKATPHHRLKLGCLTGQHRGLECSCSCTQSWGSMETSTADRAPVSSTVLLTSFKSVTNWVSENNGTHLSVQASEVEAGGSEVQGQSWLTIWATLGYQRP